MALTKVSGHIIDQPFDVGIITATNQYVSGIGTFGNIRVLGDLQVDGTTTTLDTVVTSVDRLEVGANNTTVGVAITQSGTGDIFNLYDGSSEVFSVADGGTVTVTGNIVGVTSAYATKFYGDGSALTNLAIDSTKIETGNTKVETVDTGSDGHVKVTTEGTERLRVQKGGNVVIGTTVEDTGAFRALHIHGDYSRIKLTDQFSGTGNTDGLDIQCSGGSAYYKFYENGHVYFSSNNTNRLQIKNDGQISFLNGSQYGFIKETGTGNLELGATTNVKVSTASTDRVIINADGGVASVKVGTAATLTGGFTNLQLHNASGASRIVLTDQFTGTTTDDGFHIQCSGGGATFNLKENSHIYYRTNGLLRASFKNSGEFKMHGSNPAVFGDDERFKIYYDGNCNIENTHNASNFFIASALGMQLRVNSSEAALAATANGKVQLFYDNAEKFETTSTGAKVTGALEVTQEYPSIRPTLDLNFAATKTLDRRITFTRNSLGTYTDDMGIIKYASNNVPRFDHNPATGESLGLLIEESRTNYSIYSSEFDNAAHQKLTATVVANQAVAPDGTNTAYLMYPNSSGSGRGITDSYTLTTGIYTTSLYVKSAGLQWIALYGVNGAGRGYFDIVNGTAGGSDNTGLVTYGIEDAGNGWYRCYVTINITDVSGTEYYYVYFGDSDNSVSVTANGTNGIYMWGLQTEKGSFATSYIPTGETTVTRGADQVKITGTNFTDFYNSTEGTLVTEHMGGVDANVSPYIALLSDGTNNERIMVMSDYSGYQVVVKENGANQAILDGGTPNLNVKNKNATAFKKDDFALSLNGGTVATDTSGNLSVVDQLWIGSRNGGDSYMNNTIQSVKYYNKRLPNAQLQGLTQQ